MSYHQAYFRISAALIKAYNGSEPFATYLKKYFALNKKHGSRDRKQIAHLCYCYFRLGKAAQELPVEERILAGLFLTSTVPNEILGALSADWNANVAGTLQEKAQMADINLASVFPWTSDLSERIDDETFSNSFLIQPDLFVRVRPSFHKPVIDKLRDANEPYELIPPSAVRLPVGFKIEDHFNVDKAVVIQDLSSQRIAELLELFLNEYSKKIITAGNRAIKVWDCCAASGGKSILAQDVLVNIDLTVSDVRESILVNLKKRLREAGIDQYNIFSADLAKEKAKKTEYYDLIIADLPCTGSGTWSRTPEQLYYFDRAKINEYALLQKKILGNILPALKKEGHLLYITCSVFKEENEAIVEFMDKELGLRTIQMKVFKGYEEKADTMFGALLSFTQSR